MNQGITVLRVKVKSKTHGRFFNHLYRTRKIGVRYTSSSYILTESWYLRVLFEKATYAAYNEENRTFITEDRQTTIRVYPGELRPVYYTSVLASQTTATLVHTSGNVVHCWWAGATQPSAVRNNARVLPCALFRDFAFGNFMTQYTRRQRPQLRGDAMNGRL